MLEYYPSRDASRGRAAQALSRVARASSAPEIPRSAATTAAMRGSSAGLLRAGGCPAARSAAVT